MNPHDGKTMRDELRKYLDGELGMEELSTRAREEARAWEAFFSDVRQRGPDRAPSSLENRVMREVGSRGESPAGAEATGEPAWIRLGRWLLQPRPVPISPAAGLAAAAAALALFLVLPFGDEPTRSAPPGAEQVYVEFVLEAPDASSVSVAGDFTSWSPSVKLQDADGDGVWSGRAAVRPGVHEYMFVLDGSEWVTDPNAERYSEDGFGNRNAVLAVATPRTSPDG